MSGKEQFPLFGVLATALGALALVAMIVSVAMLGLVITFDVDLDSPLFYGKRLMGCVILFLLAALIAKAISGMRGEDPP